MSPQARRRHIIEAALRLFAHRAPQDVSIDDIAEQADVSRALVYRYFPSTEAIHVAALRAATDDLIGRFTLSREGSLLEQLTASVTDFVDFATNYAPTYLALLRTGAVVVTSSDTDALIDAVRHHALTEIFERAGITDPTPLMTITVQTWIAVVEGSTLSWLQDKFCSRDELVAWHTQQFVAMMATTTALDPAMSTMLDAVTA
jgi:AcrR family transcriptional regulator